MSMLARDADGNAIPALQPYGNKAHQVAAGAASARNATAFSAEVACVEIYATEPVFLRFGDGTVVATTSDHYLPKGVSRVYSLGGGKIARATHLAAIRAGADATVYISELM
jgi:hypothetical protein